MKHQDAIWPRRDLDLEFRKAYYGGRVESYRIGPVEGEYYIWDVNSLYPFSMITSTFPDPERLKRSGFGRYAEAEGFLTATVKHPPTYIGYLPLRYNGKLVFPTGVFRGSWTFSEMRNAMRHGVEILEVHEAVSSPPLASPFEGYVKRYYHQKEEAPTVWEREIAKLMLNSLYGKFCEHHGEQEEWAAAYSEEYAAELAKQHGAVSWAPINIRRTDGYYKFAAEDGGVVAHAIYCWGAYITARARIINADVQDRIRELGGTVLYTDTDSFTSESTIAAALDAAQMTGGDLGLLKRVDCEVCKKPYRVQWVGGNKYYTKYCDCGKKTVQKGVRHGKETDYGGDGTATWNSIVGLREAIRRGMPPGAPIRRSRAAHAIYDKRVVHADGSTEALILEA